MNYQLKTKFAASGDQPQAIEKIMENLTNEQKYQLLQGATGTGKTFTMANIIAKSNKNTIIIAPNKILATQLYQEFSELFPENNVELFVSYFDYYRPEMYIKGSDSFLAKSSIINEDIDRMRHSAQAALFEKDQKTIIIATVSCLFGLIKPEDYQLNSLSVRVNQKIKFETMIEQLKDLDYHETDDFSGLMQYRVFNNKIEIQDTTSSQTYVRITEKNDQILDIELYDSTTDKKIQNLKHFIAFDKNHYNPTRDEIQQAVKEIKIDLEKEITELINHGKVNEANILAERTNEDIESMLKTGRSRGMENYIKYFSNVEVPQTILDLLGKDGLVFIDESHVTVAQINAMYKSDLKRKETLIENGYRLKSSMQNRPITLEEFEDKIGKIIYVSATPGHYELSKVNNLIVKQNIRPTGIIDPLIYVENKDNQIDDVIKHLQNEDFRRAIITTVTKQKAEELSAECKRNNLNVEYIHSGLKNTERQEILNNFKAGEYQALIGINLLREGIDVPDVSCVLILDADKSGFLRSKSALLQIIGRAARNSCGKVILYANNKTEAMNEAINETNERRNQQIKANLKYKNSSDDKFTDGKIKNILKRKEKLQLEIENEIYEAKLNNDVTLSENLKDLLIQLENIKK